MALRYRWHKEQLLQDEDAEYAFKLLRKQKPKYFAFDTETTGLNIGLDKPFFFQFGWLNTEPNPDNDITEDLAYSFAVDLESNPKFAAKIIRSWHNYLYERRNDGILYMGYNIKFDLHMMANYGMLPDEEIPITEVQFWIRYAHDAIHVGEGGPPLGLKEYATKFLDRDAKHMNRVLDRQRSDFSSKYNLDLRIQLSKDKCKVPEHLKNDYKSITASCLNEIFKDVIFELTDLPEDIYKTYMKWKKSLPQNIRGKVHSTVESDMIPYNSLNRMVLSGYALDDIVWTLEAFDQCKRVAECRNNTEAIFKIENPSLWALWRMERTGFKIDKAYLEDARIRLKERIINRRKELIEHTGEEFKVGQHAYIKKLLIRLYNLDIESTSSAELDILVSKLKREEANPNAVKCIELIQDLRTLEKWYSTYITRFKTSLDFYKTDKVWTQFNSVGAVSGRFTSNMQQMPKEGLTYEVNGEKKELFIPRKMVIVPKDEGFAGMAIIDYAAEELRFQAVYTILCGDPDLNLCRAFMPYKCHRKNGEQFDYNNKQHLKEWDSNDWFLNEDTEKLWTPTDLHSEMTVNCGFDRADPNFKSYRKIGKILNFMKNYGGGLSKVIGMFPQFSKERCKILDEAYYKTFPGVKTYHKYCERICRCEEYATNLFGTKYYGINAHKCKNILVQGSCASFLKIKLKELDDFIKANKLKSVVLAAIHDELDFYIYPGEEHYIEDFSRIMTTWEDALVPIVAEPDYGTTNWADINGKSYYDWKKKKEEKPCTY